MPSESPKPSLREIESFKILCQRTETPVLIETARQQANSYVGQGHDIIGIFLRELCNRLEAATKK